MIRTAHGQRVELRYRRETRPAAPRQSQCKGANEMSERITYLDFVTMKRLYRSVTASDRINARSELMQLRADLAEYEMHAEEARRFEPELARQIAEMQEMIAQQAQRIAELEAVLDKAAEQIENGDIRIARDVLHAAYIKT
jgi:septal ring factor EnvC (AmiA/AmiB activator)